MPKLRDSGDDLTDKRLMNFVSFHMLRTALSDPLNWLSVIMMFCDGVLMGLAGKYIVGVQALSEHYRFGQWQGLSNEIRKGAYALLAAAMMFGYPIAMRHFLGFPRAQHYAGVYAFSAPLGIIGFLWVFGLANPKVLLEQLRKEIARDTKNSSHDEQ